MGDKPYPDTRSGADLRDGREDLLKAGNLSEDATPATVHGSDR